MKNLLLLLLLTVTLSCSKENTEVTKIDRELFDNTHWSWAYEKVVSFYDDNTATSTLNESFTWDVNDGHLLMKTDSSSNLFRIDLVQYPDKIHLYDDDYLIELKFFY